MGYTYLIGWRHLDKWYYGVRFAKGCSLDDLWTKYFTSSNRVKKYREMHGEPDVVMIRKVFPDKKSAQDWERRVLVRMKVVKSPRWLNANDSFRYDFEITPEILARRREGVQRSWDMLTPEERQARLQKRREGWSRLYVCKEPSSRDRFISLSKSKLAVVNSQPLEIRSANARAGAEALKAKIASMSDEERRAHFNSQAETRKKTFASMDPDAKAAWSEKKRRTQLAKTPEEKAAFKLKIAEIKKAQWAAKKAALNT